VLAVAAAPGFIVGGAAGAIAHATIGPVGAWLAAAILTTLAWLNREGNNQPQ
jgi:uncharacterized membrane protein YeaQ/YmgE (transglycosylase-associated protein family)